MKTLIQSAIALSFLCSTVSFAQGPEVPAVKLACHGGSSYLPFDVKFTIDTQKEIIASGEAIESTGASIEGDKVVMTFSASECEDSTEVKFDKKEFFDLVNGKTTELYGDLRQEEPNVQMSLYIECKLTP